MRHEQVWVAKMLVLVVVEDINEIEMLEEIEEGKDLVSTIDETMEEVA